MILSHNSASGVLLINFCLVETDFLQSRSFCCIFLEWKRAEFSKLGRLLREQ